MGYVEIINYDSNFALVRFSGGVVNSGDIVYVSLPSPIKMQVENVVSNKDFIIVPLGNRSLPNLSYGTLVFR